MRQPRNFPKRQRGVALIIALVLVALATILATKLTYDGFLERQRTTGMLAAEQSLEFNYGAEALASDVLSQTNLAMVTLNDPWAQPAQPFPITPQNDPEGEPIGTLEGSLEDMQGRFNLNSLGRYTPDGKPDPVPLEQFQRLLAIVGLEPKWAGMLRDWIDADQDVSSPDGAEDSVYLGQTPPYRTGDYPMLSATELMNLPGFGIDRFKKIAPYVTALPDAKSTINPCTASGPVLESLSPQFAGDFNNPDFLASNRKKGCFPDKPTLSNMTAAGDKVWAATSLLVLTQSKYFRLTTRVSLGTYEFTLYSLLFVVQGKQAVPILRSYGTP
jgi:general secretion pathway protein K